MNAAVALIPHRTTPGLWLSVTRKDDHTNWGLPGGKLEQGESPVEAVIRETLEETGVHIVVGTMVCIDEVEKAHVHAFLVTDWEGEPTQQEGEGLVAWQTEEELSKGVFGDFNARRFRMAKEGFLANALLG